MIICGIKITHDGGVAVIEDGRLLFSVEMEKIGNAERHRDIADLSEIFDVLRSFGVSPQDVDCFAMDGWRKTDRHKPWYGQEIRIPLAPYRRGYLSDDPLRHYRYQIADFDYLSFPHYTGHVLAGYCASPFARRREGSYVLCWDGAMFPYLYYVDAPGQKVISRGPVLHFLGDAYHAIAKKFAPFDSPAALADGLALPGKVMAYIARGEVRGHVLDHMDRCYRAAEAEIIAPVRAGGDDASYSESLARRFLASFEALFDPTIAAPADMLASWHGFLQTLLIESLEAKLGQEQWPARNLIFVGGCALNIKWNRALLDRQLANELWVPPFPNDAGAAIGAACCAWVTQRGFGALDWDVFSGPDLIRNSPAAGWLSRPCSLAELARLLYEQDEPVVFLHGRAELGPRALGHRSLLASPLGHDMKHRLNAMKGREDYRPVAPVCVEASAPAIFSPGTPDPYMLFEQMVRPHWAARIPAVCHEDGTARVQTVNRADDPTLFELLTEFERVSGVPVLCNTSANLPGRGFFPDLESATRWGKARYVWCDGLCYEQG